MLSLYGVGEHFPQSKPDQNFPISPLFRLSSRGTDNKLLHNTLKILIIFFRRGLLSGSPDNKRLRKILKTSGFYVYSGLLSGSPDNKLGSWAGAGL